MNKNEYELLKNIENKDPVIYASDFPVGTLTYGFGINGDGTVHVYVDYPLGIDGKNPEEKHIFVLKTKRNLQVSLECETEFNPLRLKPSKRSYADRTSFEFAKAMILAGQPLSLTGVNDLPEDNVSLPNEHMLTHTNENLLILNDHKPALNEMLDIMIDNDLVNYDICSKIYSDEDDHLRNDDSLMELRELYGYHKTFIGLVENALYPFVIFDNDLSMSIKSSGESFITDTTAELEKKKAIVDERISELSKVASDMNGNDFTAYLKDVQSIADKAEEHLTGIISKK